MGAIFSDGKLKKKTFIEVFYFVEKVIQKSRSHFGRNFLKAHLSLNDCVLRSLSMQLQTELFFLLLEFLDFDFRKTTVWSSYNSFDNNVNSRLVILNKFMFGFQNCFPYRYCLLFP